MNERDTLSGLLFCIAAYVLWGLMPLYWHLLADIPAGKVTVHRVLWCAVTVGILVAARGRLASVIESVRDRRLLVTLFVSGLLIAFNWGIYIWAVDANELVQTSLGYYITPLVTIALGVVFLGEKMSAMRRSAVILGLVAVGLQTAAAGDFPGVAVALALAFGVYGYLRKTARIGALEGVFVEAALLFPFMAAFVGYWSATGTGALFRQGWLTDFLLIFSGPLTALPLVLFAAGARRMRLTTVGFLQYLAPTITLAVATLVFREPFTVVHAVTFACVWTALLLLALDGTPARIRTRIRNARNARQKSVSLPPASTPPG